jgi:excisionase family DNA binding protein
VAELDTRAAVSRDEAAAMYGVSLNTIRRAIASGALRAKKVGPKYRIDVAELRAWFEALPDA